MSFYIRLMIVFFVALGGTHAMADGEICFVGEGFGPIVENTIEGPGTNLEPFIITDMMAAAPQCKDLKPYIAALDASMYVFYVASAGLACSGIGAPASVSFIVAGVALHSLNFIVKNIPCEQSIPAEIIEHRVEQKVCELLKNSGFDCRGKRISN